MAEAIDGRGGSKRPGRTARAWTGAMALAAVALLLQLPAPVARAGGITSAAPTGPLKIYARITLPSTAGEMFSSAAPAEAPDGAVFMASVTNNDNTVVWVVDGDGPATVAEHVSGVVHALRLTAKRATGSRAGRCPSSAPRTSLITTWWPCRLSTERCSSVS